MKAPLHPRQIDRVAALQDYGILDVPRETEFDEVAALAAELCGAPIGVVNLVDAERQFFLAEVGLGVRSTPLDTALCTHAILEHDYLEVNDTLTDPRFADNPLCTGDMSLRFYAGALLTTGDGLPIGTLCVLDRVPRSLSDTQRRALKVLARQVMRQLDLRVSLRRQDLLQREMDHRVKNSLQSVASFVRLQAARMADADGKLALEAIGRRIATVALLHQELSSTSTAERIPLDSYMTKVGALFRAGSPQGVDVDVRFAPITVSSDTATALAAIANEFVANSLKYAFPDGRQGVVEMCGEMGPEGEVIVRFADSGVGMGSDAVVLGTGLGMRIMEAATAQLGGTLTVEAVEVGHAITVRFPLERSIPPPPVDAPEVRPQLNGSAAARSVAAS